MNVHIRFAAVICVQVAEVAYRLLDCSCRMAADQRSGGFFNLVLVPFWGIIHCTQE